MNRLPVWLLLPLFLAVRVDCLHADCVYGLVIDTSGSMRPAIDQIVAGARPLIKKSGPGDRFFMVKFTDEATLEEEATGQKERILDALDNLVVSGHPSIVLDAVFLSAEKMHKLAQPAGCKALVLITDGDEQASYHKIDDVLRALRQERLPVFVIGFPHIIPEQKGKKAQKKAVKLLEQLAKGTGGGVWFPRTEADLAVAVDEIQKRMSK